MFCDIKKQLGPIKAHYVLFFGAMGSMYPFIPIIITNMGFSSNIVGIVFLWLPICGMFAKTWFGALADKFKRQRFCFLLFIFASLAFTLLILLLLAITKKPSASLECNSSGTNFNFCSGSRIAEKEKLAFLKENTSKMTCRLVCHNDTSNVHHSTEELCKSWGLSSYCGTSKFSSSQDDLSSPASMVSLEDVFASLKQKQPGHKHSIFEFSTFVSKNSSFELNNCMYFPLEKLTYRNAQIQEMKCSKTYVSICDMHCESHALNELWIQSTADAQISDTDAFRMSLFWILFLILIGVSSSLAVVMIIGDAICFKLLEDEPELFGLQRLWGSIGWGLAAFASGYLVDLANEGKEYKNYKILLYTSIVLFVLDLIAAFNIKCVQTEVSPSIFKDVSNLLKKPQVVVFFAWCIIVGFFSAIVWNFLFLYIEDLAAAFISEKDLMVKTLQGLVVSVQTIGGEVPFFFLSGPILKKIGHINAMSLVLAAFSIRFILISLVVNPWYILPVELLNGLTYGMLTVAMNSYAALIAPPGTESTMQGLVGAIFEGIGASVGSFLCGSLYDTYGGRNLFRIFSAIAAVSFIVHVLIQFVLNLSKPSKKYRGAVTEGIENEGLQMQ
ncbi:unnamed protein product [Bemisia tabaci]|uniref:Major facilitator superfamily (MFS) profile domain-containing protein n=1 Tax=Bemisia tabaci TaxID=7038 RepID=A0A9P0F304_BEMTA|nr:unnamed protein product [Bemisia tabaci]